MGGKFKFYVTVETNDYDDYPHMSDSDIKDAITAALGTYEWGDIFAFKNVIVTLWEDVRADFKSAMDSMIVHIPDPELCEHTFDDYGLCTKCYYHLDEESE
jgi:hypothetical protein